MRPAPLIGVTTSMTVGSLPERAYVNSAYIRAVQEAGGVPVLLPPQLAGVLGASEVEVNSFHHQAIGRLGEGLRAVAWSPDGIVEGAEMDESSGFVIAVQWHPEDLVTHDATARSLFRALVDEIRTRS